MHLGRYGVFAEQTLADKQQTIQQVVAMREALEQMHADKQSSVQQVMADASDEIAQLKATVHAMREEMDQVQFEKQRAIA